MPSHKLFILLPQSLKGNEALTGYVSKTVLMRRGIKSFRMFGQSRSKYLSDTTEIIMLKIPTFLLFGNTFIKTAIKISEA